MFLAARPKILWKPDFEDGIMDIDGQAGNFPGLLSFLGLIQRKCGRWEWISFFPGNARLDYCPNVNVAANTEL